jgi:hypothetical protein
LKEKITITKQHKRSNFIVDTFLDEITVPLVRPAMQPMTSGIREKQLSGRQGPGSFSPELQD